MIDTTTVPTSAHAQFTFGMTNSFSYKNFDHRYSSALCGNSANYTAINLSMKSAWTTVDADTGRANFGPIDPNKTAPPP